MKTLDPIVHRTHLSNLLIDFYKNSFLAGVLGFKGGTAAMFFYDLPRFSVDLDFDFIGKDPSKIAEVFRRVSEIVSQKYTIKDQYQKQNTLFWLVSYGPETANIKIEISLRDVSLNRYESHNFFGVSVLLLKVEDMIARKLIAVVNRKIPANRDLFDAHFFLSSQYASEINSKILENYSGGNARFFYQELLEHINRIEEESILKGLGELLSEKQKQWVGGGLLRELKGLTERQIYLSETSS